MSNNDNVSIGFDVPFEEAISAMDARGIVLPAQYYGELQGIQRQLNFSIAGVASLDQLQAVLDSLTSKLAEGQSFKEWQDSVAVKDLGLPKHRLDNIFRTNIQNAYNRGHWEQIKQNEKFQPYLMYDAINDSRTRPSHRALDGVIRRIDDPFWDTHYPANGYRCRCSVVALTEKQAQARSNGDNGLNKKIETDKMKPDKGWDYNCGADITEGINKAIAEKAAKAAENKVEPKLAKKLKEKTVVPKDDPLHKDKIVAKKPADAPPKVEPKPKAEPKPKDAPKPKTEPKPPKDTPKLASETPQTNPDAQKWTKEHIDKVQKMFPDKFVDGVFNPHIVKVGDKITDTKTGQTWKVGEKAPAQKKPKTELKKTTKSSSVSQSDPIAATWDDKSLGLMKEKFPQNFDKNGNWVNPSKTKPTPSNERVKEVLKDGYKPEQKTALPAKKSEKQKTEDLKYTLNQKVDDATIERRRSTIGDTTKEQQEKMDKALKSFFGEKYRKEKDFVSNAKLAKEAYGLSVPEHEAIYTYTGALHGRLNEQMGFRLADGIAHKADILEGYGDVLSQALKKMPTTKGTVHRAVSLPQEVIDSYVVGEERLEVEFWSATHAGYHVFSGNVHFEIKSKTGRNIEPLSKYSDDEMETLFDRNTNFRVISKTLVNKENDKLNGAWQIELEEV